VHWSIILLAAGKGSRLGNIPKGLIRIDGQCLIQRLASAARVLQPVETLLVTGRDHGRMAQEVARWPQAQRPVLCLNPEPGPEPSDSLKAGLRAIRRECDAIMVLLADLVQITATDLQQAAAAFEARPPGVELVLPEVAGTPGHPVMFSRALARQMLARDDLSIRRWREEQPHRSLTWITDNHHHVSDIDTPADLERIRTETGAIVLLPSPALDEPPRA
jgi:molybdenum cofactor cytidylyltransferase